MSLTKHLNTFDSPVREFLRKEFPDSRAIQRSCRDCIVNSTTIRPSAPIRYGTVGMALDFRLRYYFAVTPVNELVAYDGASCLAVGRHASRSPRTVVAR